MQVGVQCQKPTLSIPMVNPKCIQDLHSLVCEDVCLHSDRDLNGSYELFGLVPIPIKWFRISCFSASDWVV